MNRTLIGAGAALAFGWVAVSPALAADPASLDRGNRVFQYNCAPCHGSAPGERARFLPGTEALNAKYKGEKPALLEQRTDLTPDFVGYVIRHGIEGMPFFRKTEISNADMAAVGAYLTRNNK